MDPNIMTNCRCGHPKKEHDNEDGSCSHCDNTNSGMGIVAYLHCPKYTDDRYWITEKKETMKK